MATNAKPSKSPSRPLQRGVQHLPIFTPNGNVVQADDSVSMRMEDTNGKTPMARSKTFGGCTGNLEFLVEKTFSIL
jgi:hypothetical protein